MAMQIAPDITSRSVKSISAAIAEVEGFVNDVKELMATGSITATEGGTLVEAANDLRVRLLSCLAEFRG
jgi:hypothetical protein